LCLFCNLECESAVEESQKSIKQAEASISTLVKQQAQTKRKLSQLYHELIAVTSDTIAVSHIQRRGYDSYHANACWIICMYNALSCNTGSNLLRHSYLSVAHKSIPLLESAACVRHEISRTESSISNGIDPFVPLCPYALAGTCTDEVSGFLIFIWFQRG
jgi:hypothetical protein